MNNFVDLTGMVFDSREVINDDRAILYFVLNVQNRYYDSTGKSVVKYQKIPCAISKRFGQKHTAYYDYLRKNLVPKSILRVQGKIDGYYKEEFNSETDEERYVLSNLVWVQDYLFQHKLKIEENELDSVEDEDLIESTKKQEVEKYRYREEFESIADQGYLDFIYDHRPMKFGG